MVSYTLISAAVLAIAGISPWSAMAAPVSSSDMTSADGGPPGGDNGNHWGWYKHGHDGDQGDEGDNQGDDNDQGDNGNHYGWGKHNHTSGGQPAPSSSFGGNYPDPMPTASMSIMPLPSMSASLTPSVSSGSSSSTATQSASASSKPSASGSSAAPSSSSSAAAGDSSSSSDQDQIVELHNKFRSQHSAPPLKWNETLAEFAQNWSDGCKFEHSQNGMYGENLAWNYGDWEKAITAWYDEEKDYDYNSASFSSGTGHFTQIVWADTTQIGCGVSDCSNGPIYTCSYYPPGNVQGQFQENVKPKN